MMGKNFFTILGSNVLLILTYALNPHYFFHEYNISHLNMHEHQQKSTIMVIGLRNSSCVIIRALPELITTNLSLILFATCS